jgi:hypothetical protein
VTITQVRRQREICAKRTAPSLEFVNNFDRLRKLIQNKLRLSAEEERAMQEQLEKLQVYCTITVDL